MLEFLGLPTDIELDAWEASKVETHVIFKRRCDNCTKTGAATVGCVRRYLRYIDGRLVETARNCEKGNCYAEQQRIDALAKKSNMDARFEDRRFDNFKPIAGTKTALNSCRDLCDQFANRLKGGYKGAFKGLYLCGAPGCGKTHLAAAVWNELKKRGFVGVFVVAADYLDLKKRAMDTPELKPVAEELFIRARTAPLLILDDLGREKPSKWTKEQLFILIDARYRNGLPMIITSNYAFGDGKNEIGNADTGAVDGATFSRLGQMTDVIWIDAPDYRLKKVRS